MNMMLEAMIDKAVREAKQAELGITISEFTPPMTGAMAPTEKQINFFKELVMKKDMAEDHRVMYKKMLQTLSRTDISKVINVLVSLPWVPRPVNQIQVSLPPTVPQSINAGRYAVQRNGELEFYEVRKPTEGKWAGWVFLSKLSGDNALSVRDKAEREAVYALIGKDQIGALKLYGQKIGQCGHCRKTLTDAVSRDFGIGPVCRKQLGV
jgi:hypothetical protein